MSYVLPTRHAKAASWLQGSVRQQKAVIAADLKERMAVVLEEGEEAPDVAHFMDVLARMVKHESEVLDAADEERIKEGGHVKWLQLQRAEADAETRAQVIRIRDRVRGVYGAKEAKIKLGIKGRTPLNPQELEVWAAYLVAWLPRQEWEPEEDCTLNPKKWAEDLRPAWERLRDVLEELELRRDRKAEGVAVKQAALKISAQTYSRAVRLLELIYELADHPILARRLRRRFGGRPRRRKALVKVSERSTVPKRSTAALAGGAAPRLVRGAGEAGGAVAREGPAHGRRLRLTVFRRSRHAACRRPRAPGMPLGLARSVDSLF